MNISLIFCAFIPMCVWAQLLSCAWLFATPWTVAHQAPLSMGFSQQGYWSGLPFSPPEGLPNPRPKRVFQTHVSCVSCIGRQILYHWATWEAHIYHKFIWKLYWNYESFFSVYSDTFLLDWPKSSLGKMVKNLNKFFDQLNIFILKVSPEASSCSNLVWLTPSPAA